MPNCHIEGCAQPTAGYRTICDLHHAMEEAEDAAKALTKATEVYFAALRDMDRATRQVADMREEQQERAATQAA